MNFIIYTDGGSRGNPGPCAASFVIQSEDGVIWVEEAKFLGVNTNNVAEYTAFKLALERLIADFQKHLPTKVEFRSDSMLVTQQLSGKFKIKNANLKKIYLQIKTLEPLIGRVSYKYIPREKNIITDRLVNRILDQEMYGG